MKDSPLLNLAERIYRSDETARLSLRLSYTMMDLLNSILHFCEKEGIELDEGTWRIIDEAYSINQKMKGVHTMPLSELMRRPPTILKHSLETTKDETEPTVFSAASSKDVTSYELVTERQSLPRAGLR